MLSKYKNKTLNTTRILVSCFFLIAVVFPLVKLFFNLGNVDLKEVFSNELTLTAIGNSIKVSVCATVISVSLAMMLALCINRTNVKGKGFFHLLLILPMLIPSISHGMGLIFLFGSNGILTNYFGFSNGLYGFWGIVIGSVMYSLPVAYLMISDLLKYEDATPYEAAVVLGLKKRHRFSAITLPYLRKSMINVIFATFTMIVTDYGVPIMVGSQYKTLPVLMYEEVIGRLDFNKGSAFGAILLIPAVLAFVIDTLCRNNNKNGYTSKPFTIKKSVIRDGLSYIFLGIISFCIVYPIITFARIAFATRYPRDMSFSTKHIQSVIDKGALDYLMNSIVVALAVALVGTFISFFCAYFTTRMQSKSSLVIHMLSITSLAIPGVVLGLSYVLVFKGTPIYGTIAILILVNIIHFFSSPYLMMYNSLGKINKNLEAVGMTLGISRLSMIRHVFIPQTKSTLVEMFSYFFVNSMMTISAVAFLATSTTKPISLMINQFEAQSLLEASAFVSVVILAVNLCMKGLIAVIKKLMDNRMEKRNVNKETV